MSRHDPIINHRRTAARAVNLRRLIAELQTRDMLRDEIMAFLGIGQSTANGYMQILHELVRASSCGQQQNSYCLTADAEQVTTFFAALDAPGGIAPRKQAPSTPLAKAMLNPVRRFHICADDEFHAVKVHKGPAMRDPLALPVRFFRAAKQERRA
jgi:hypothetical protein